MHGAPQYYELDPAKKVTRVEGSTVYTCDIKFFDSDNTELLSVRPGPYLPIVSHAIGPNEKLIGVYGVKRPDSYMTSFGFLVKVNQP